MAWALSSRAMGECKVMGQGINRIYYSLLALFWRLTQCSTSFLNTELFREHLQNLIYLKDISHG